MSGRMPTGSAGASSISAGGFAPTATDDPTVARVAGDRTRGSAVARHRGAAGPRARTNGLPVVICTTNLLRGQQFSRKAARHSSVVPLGRLPRLREPKARHGAEG